MPAGFIKKEKKKKNSLVRERRSFSALRLQTDAQVAAAAVSGRHSMRNQFGSDFTLARVASSFDGNQEALVYSGKWTQFFQRGRQTISKEERRGRRIEAALPSAGLLGEPPLRSQERTHSRTGVTLTPARRPLPVAAP